MRQGGDSAHPAHHGEKEGLKDKHTWYQPGHCFVLLLLVLGKANAMWTACLGSATRAAGCTSCFDADLLQCGRTKCSGKQNIMQQ
jgi:hypothetical protein